MNPVPERSIGRSNLQLIGIAYLSFVALGVPGGLLGVAWPSVMRSFGLSLDDVGVVLIALTAGSLLSSFASGPVISRLGAGWFLAGSSAIAAAGLLGFAIAPGWWFVVLSGLLLGVAAGGVDSALNVHFAENHGSRLMNWLHACFGLGATFGPVLMTALLLAGHSWRWGYAIVGAAQVFLALSFGLTVSKWRAPARPSGDPEGALTRDVSVWASVRLPVIWLSVGVFLLAAGVESVAGQWPYSLYTEARGVEPAVAGLWISVYWGALTVSRILYGIAGSRLNDVFSLRVGMLAVVLGAAFVWMRSSELLSFLGLALMGFAIAPVLPLLQLVTPRRVGVRHTANAIGFQTAAGYIGVGILPALAGYLAERQGLETIGPFMVAGSIATILLHELVVRHQADPSRRRGFQKTTKEVVDGEA